MHVHFWKKTTPHYNEFVVMTVLCLFVVPSTCLIYFNWKSPTLPRMTVNTLQRAGGTSPHSLWMVRVGGECNGDVEQKKQKGFPVKRIVPFPTCLKAMWSSMCVQISITGGDFPCLRLFEWISLWGTADTGGKSDRVPENIQGLELQRFVATAVELCWWNR